VTTILPYCVVSSENPTFGVLGHCSAERRPI